MVSIKSRLLEWHKAWKKELYEYKYLIILSIILIIFSAGICFQASTYVDRINTVPVPDLILDNIPALNLGWLYAYGFLAVLTTLTIYTLIFRAKRFHEVAFLFCLLILVRSIFIMLTHVGIPADAKMDVGIPELYQHSNFRNDLFFSGHAAMPFLAFLIFRKEKIGMFFLAMSIILSATVLLMHVHYSIDVFSAFFITYGVYKLGEHIISSRRWNDVINRRKTT